MRLLLQLIYIYQPIKFSVQVFVLKHLVKVVIMFIYQLIYLLSGSHSLMIPVLNWGLSTLESGFLMSVFMLILRVI